MLKIIEYSLLAVSLLVVVGLIVSGSHGSSDPTSAQAGALSRDRSDPQESGKAH
jgi:hypothetical protein